MFGLLHHLLNPTQCYALCAVARSGAHLLAGGLRATHLAGRPLQYFNQHLAQKYAARYGLDAVRNFSHYVRGIVPAASTSNAVFGFRMESWDLAGFVGRLRESGEFDRADAREIELLHAAFPRLRCIQLTRRGQTATGDLQSSRDANQSLGDCHGKKTCGRAEIRSRIDRAVPHIRPASGGNLVRFLSTQRDRAAFHNLRGSLS